MSWTAEELAMLKRRAGEGLSAGKIAEYLPGKSRNAVIGMLRRGEGRYGQLQGQPPKLKPKPVRNFVGKRAVEKALAPAPVAPVEALFVSPDCPGFSRPIGPARPQLIPEAKASEDNGSTANGPNEAGTAVTGDASRARGGADTAPTNLPATLPITFLEAMMTDRCLHYVCAPYDPDGPDMPVCGQPRAGEPVGTRYCRRHLLLRSQVAA